MGGSGTTTNDPDIALGCFSWSSSPASAVEGQRQLCDTDCSSRDAAAVTDHSVAAAPSATVLPISSAQHVPVPALVRVSTSQEGDVPPARIGHAAVTLTTSSLRSPPLSRLNSIFVFGGEASNPSTCDEDGSGPPVYPKYADVYEATPKATSGALIWRALSPPRAVSPRDPTIPDSEPHVAFPAPVAFHASCAASVCVGGGGNSGSGTERALLIHGGKNQSSELLADLWAFFPGRLSKVASNGGGAVVEGGDGGSVNSDQTTGWERLQPQGEG